MKRSVNLAISLALTPTIACAGMSSEQIAEYPIPFYDHTLPIEERLDDISARLTNREKGLMITQRNEGVPRFGMRSFMPGEALHGLSAPRDNPATVFPQSIGLAAMWDPEAMTRMGDAVSDEARAQYHNGPVLWGGRKGPLGFWSPVVNIARDPRWGRTQEAYGEDPLINGTLAAAYVRGLQGDHPKYLKTAAGAKHFVANNTEHDRFHANADISEKQLREYYFPAYKQAVQEGDAKIIMTAYNALNGEPAVTNTWLVKDVLRGEWGFDGFVIGDYASAQMITKGWAERGFYGHEIYDTTADSIAAVLNAETLDYTNEGLFHTHGPAVIAEGKAKAESLDRAFRNVMRVALRLGMFDPEELSPWKDIPFETMTTFKPLALELAEKSMVLLQNEPVSGTPLLPLDRSALKTVAVIGPNADVLNYGTYAGTATDPVTPLQGIRNHLGDDVEVLYVPWTHAVEDVTRIPMDNLTTLDAQGMGGWQAVYHNDAKAHGKPDAETFVADVDFSWTDERPHKALVRDRYAATFTTTVVPPQSGRYTFAVDNLGGDVQVQINGAPFIRDHGEEPDVKRLTKAIDLDATQTYEIKVINMRKTDYEDHRLRLAWQLPQEKSNFEGGELDVAKQVDAVIAVMGISVEYERESIDRPFEGLPQEQVEMLNGVLNANPNTVVVLQSGSSIESPWLKENAPAILQSWYPGEQGGVAIANTLFGDYNPGGKLPLTWVRTWDDLPPFADYDITKGRSYWYFDKEPLWAFGHGLSYTNFKLDKLKIHSRKVNVDGTIDLSVRVKNTGKMDGDEVVQVYVADIFERSDKPKQRLKAFERVTVPAGKSQVVELSIDVADLAYWDEHSQDWSLGDRYEIRVGNASDRLSLTKTIEVR
ncbi:glycoside hydrolase family 3 C-terminal domain-containing protein [Ferrimonas pelagia]|uniref:Glycoside hydrolase family 3 C-terminal domain-containing protein n=1 Tax=Ferrimonas pelagia TaxID=1177826 RepID=A0ABP9FJ25_9GAMM